MNWFRRLWLRVVNFGFRLRAIFVKVALSVFVFGLRIAEKGFGLKGIISLVVYIMMIPIIQEMLESLSGSLTGTAGTLLSAVISIIPLVLVMKVLDKLNL